MISCGAAMAQQERHPWSMHELILSVGALCAITFAAIKVHRTFDKHKNEFAKKPI